MLTNPKFCPRCKKWTRDFYGGTKDYPYCAPCRREYNTEWRRANPDKVAILKQKHKKRNEESRLRRLYNLDFDGYDRLLEFQGGGCAICGSSEPKVGNSRLPIDHSHDSGKRRGILCDACNRGLGYFRDCPELLIAAAQYLEIWRILDGEVNTVS